MTATKTPIITIKNNAAITNSSHVAEYFGKLHKNVLQDIDNLIAMEPSIGLNFQLDEIEAKVGFGTRKVRAFNMTRDGFTLLAMGFTGKKALGFKLQYIQQFNVMEEMLKAPVKEQPKAETMVPLSVVANILRTVADQLEGAVVINQVEQPAQLAKPTDYSNDLTPMYTARQLVAKGFIKDMNSQEVGIVLSQHCTKNGFIRGESKNGGFKCFTYSRAAIQDCFACFE